MSQKDNILFHLEEFGSITPLEALKEYGCFRLAARISDLKQDGHIIVTCTQKNKNKQYAKYFLQKG